MSKVHKPGKKRWMLWTRQGGVCPLCLRGIKWNAQLQDEKPTLDHIIPVSRGGSGQMTNLRVVHHVCNQRRANRLGEAHWADTPDLIARAFLGVTP